MKLRKYFLHLRKQLRKFGQKGQTLVEFVLLLAVISTISYAFVAFMNRSLATYWEQAAYMVIRDGNPRADKPKID
jgi:competence protein ComGC